MTTRAPSWICPENAFMNENYIHTKLKAICFQQKFPVICQKEVYKWVPTVLILKLWCDAPHQLLFSSSPWAGIMLVTAAEPRPHSRIGKKGGGRTPWDLGYSHGAEGTEKKGVGDI